MNTVVAQTLGVLFVIAYIVGFAYLDSYVGNATEARELEAMMTSYYDHGYGGSNYDVRYDDDY